MVDKKRENWFVLAICILLALFTLWGAASVPFHPDESTHIFMSSDLIALIQNPQSLSYTPSQSFTPEMRYRAIDTPLTRYLIGIGRFLAGSPPLEADWDWSSDWQTNLSAGAYPGATNLLSHSRLLLTMLIPASCYLLYLAARKLMPFSASLLAALLLGLNPLILLHGRRAMAEPALTLGICLFLWAVTREKIHPLSVGLSLAITINAKQTGIFFLPVGIIAVGLGLEGENRLRKLLTRELIALVSLLLISLLLNPYYWSAPIKAFSAGIQLRADLLQAQIVDFLGGDRLTIFERTLALANNLLLSQPSYAETPNYSTFLAPQIAVYESIFLHTWTRGLIAGSIQLAFMISGIILLFKRFNGYPAARRRSFIILLISTISVFIGVVLAIQLPWQRYAVPLVPLTTIWISMGASPLIEYARSLQLDNRPSKSA